MIVPETVAYADGDTPLTGLLYRPAGTPRASPAARRATPLGETTRTVRLRGARGASAGSLAPPLRPAGLRSMPPVEGDRVLLGEGKAGIQGVRP